jgi:hypothetical protein
MLDIEKMLYSAWQDRGYSYVQTWLAGCLNPPSHISHSAAWQAVLARLD